jgi:hypothetical protein
VRQAEHEVVREVDEKAAQLVIKLGVHLIGLHG